MIRPPREIHEFYAQFHVARDMLELRNLMRVSDLIVMSVMLQRESRGQHYSLDHPGKMAEAKPTILVPPGR